MDIDREERIRQRAYELWQQEGSPKDRPLGHWLQAEREIDQTDSVMEKDEMPNVAAMHDVEREHPEAFMGGRDDAGEGVDPAASGERERS